MSTGWSESRSTMEYVWRSLALVDDGAAATANLWLDVPLVSTGPGAGTADCTPHHAVTYCGADPSVLMPGQAIVTWTEWDGLSSVPGQQRATRSTITCLTIGSHHATLV